jgi:cation diffusion facilitator family transporter
MTVEQTLNKDGVPSTRRVVAVSLLVDVFDIVSNLVVALFTGSAVIFAEMAQGMADAIGSLLLVIGERRSRLPGDDDYPAGHTREVFFWALLSALVLLVVGSGLSFSRGYSQWVQREVLENPWMALGILTVSVTTNGYAARQSYLRLGGAGLGVWKAFRSESQPLVKTAFLQDTLGTLSSVMGLFSLGLYFLFDKSPIFDAVGAMAAAALMVVFGVILVVQMHHFITGRPVPLALRNRFRSAAQDLDGVVRVNALTATFSGSVEIVLEADLDLSETLNTVQIEALLDELQAAMRRVDGRVGKVRVDLNSPTLEQAE